jgi:hypothetical protein
VDALGVALIGVGGFLLYSAIRSVHPHPWSLFLATLGAPAPTQPYTAASGQAGTATIATSGPGAMGE